MLSHSLAVVLCLHLGLSIAPHSPRPDDPLDFLIGTWEGTLTTTQRGQCSMNGQREAKSQMGLVFRRDVDDTVRGGMKPHGYTGRVGLLWTVEVKDRILVQYPKTVTCGTDTRQTMQSMSAVALPPDGDVRKLRLTGFSATCPQAGCVFDERFDLVWKGPPPELPAADK